MDAEKQVVRVAMGSEGEFSATLEYETEDGSRTAVPLPLNAKIVDRMGHLRTQFFFARRRNDGSWKLGAYAPWRDW